MGFECNENDGWREPWPKMCKCGRCGKTILMIQSRLIVSNTFEVHGVPFTSEIRYCSDCYRQNMDKLTKIVEIASGKEVKHESQ